jgi:hypothetical protein
LRLLPILFSCVERRDDADSFSPFTLTRRTPKVNDFFGKSADFPRFLPLASAPLASAFQERKKTKKIEKSPLRGSQSRL